MLIVCLHICSDKNTKIIGACSKITNWRLGGERGAREYIERDTISKIGQNSSARIVTKRLVQKILLKHWGELIKWVAEGKGNSN